MTSLVYITMKSVYYFFSFHFFYIKLNSLLIELAHLLFLYSIFASSHDIWSSFIIDFTASPKSLFCLLYLSCCSCATCSITTFTEFVLIRVLIYIKLKLVSIHYIHYECMPFSHCPHHQFLGFSSLCWWVWTALRFVFHFFCFPLCFISPSVALRVSLFFSLSVWWFWCFQGLVYLSHLCRVDTIHPCLRCDTNKWHHNKPLLTMFAGIQISMICSQGNNHSVQELQA